MFNKANDYRKLTFITYPGGNVLHPSKCSFDFDNGEKEEEKYKKESEKFKLVSLKAQSDISERETLADDTLRITIEVDNRSFTFVSAAGFINIAFAKVLATMTDEQLDKLQEKFREEDSVNSLRMADFEALVNEIGGDEATKDIAFTAHIKIHDSYTVEHIRAIKYIIGALYKDYENKGSELVIASNDPDLKNAIVDLGMSTYFDIEIEE